MKLKAGDRFRVLKDGAYSADVKKGDTGTIVDGETFTPGSGVPYYLRCRMDGPAERIWCFRDEDIERVEGSVKGYFALYSEQSTLRTKAFDSAKARKEWVGGFLADHCDNIEDYHVLMLFSGEVDKLAMDLARNSA